MSVAWEQVASHARSSGARRRALRSVRWPVVAGLAFAFGVSLLGWVAIWELVRHIVMLVSS